MKSQVSILAKTWNSIKTAKNLKRKSKKKYAYLTEKN